MTIQAEMRPWQRLVYVVVILFMMTTLSHHAVEKVQDFQMNKEMLATVEPTMHDLGILEILIVVNNIVSVFSLLIVVLTRYSKLLKFMLYCEQPVFFISIGIVLCLLYAKFPSLEKDKAMLNNAMRGYGKEAYTTQMIETTQRLLHCCGVDGYTDWKLVNTTYINSLTYEVDKAVATVPETCATVDKTSVQFHPSGCLPLFFGFKMHTVYTMALHVVTQTVYEVIVLLLIAGILMEPEDADAVADVKSRQGQNVPIVYILDVPPPMTLED